MLGEMLKHLRAAAPRVHCIANYVTANDCANLLLAAGASPVMADDPMESAQITACCDALTLSMGTPNARKIEAMALSAAAAREKRIPVILDPVGVTLSDVRLRAVEGLIACGAVSIIRGNASEIRVLAEGTSGHTGLEAEDETEAICESARRLASDTGAIVVMTGRTDVITDGRRLCRVANGDEILRSITGAGCQLTALLGAFAAANPCCLFEASIAAACMMGLCAELALARMPRGSASCRNFMIDEAYAMTERTLREGAKYEME